MRITREQLAKEHAQQAATIDWQAQKLNERNEKDLRLRKRFQKVLNQRPFRQEHYQFGLETLRGSEELSWEEIFCEVGKLLEHRISQQWTDRVDQQLRDLCDKVFTKPPPPDQGFTPLR